MRKKQKQKEIERRVKLYVRDMSRYLEKMNGTTAIAPEFEQALKAFQVCGRELKAMGYEYNISEDNTQITVFVLEI